MKRNSLFTIHYSLFALLLLASCHSPQVPDSFSDAGQAPDIYPDYAGVTVPVNMAPLHFQLMQQADEVVARFTAGSEQLVCEGPKVRPDEADWQALVASAGADGTIAVELFALRGGKWLRYNPFSIYVSPDSIDPWLSDRIISPSYVTYEDLTIRQRCLESYEERIIYDNMLCSTEKDGQCINCHNYQLGNPRRMQFHARQNLGGTVVSYDGSTIKTNLKTDSTLSAGVYPAWHPRLPLIAYSTNNTMQVFHTRDVNKIEVLDAASDLILYDLDRGEVSTIENDPNEFEVFPCWSPDGKWLYYSSAHFVLNDSVEAETQVIKGYRDIKYSVYRKAFDEKTLTFGPREMVFDAAAQGLSATVPRLSPDGRWLLLSVGEWGCFHIWHHDADLWLMDLQNDSIRTFDEVNSPNTEAWHNWSRSGRWIVFSSRRYDGDFTRPFFAHVDKDGRATKPFELPQDDPDYHRQLMRSYNLPELMMGPVEITPQEFADVLKQDAVPAKFVSR